MIIFRQLFDPESSTYTYLLADAKSREAVLIDPVYEQVLRDAALLEELDLRLRFTLDTHVHADHVTGAWALAQRAGSLIALAEVSRAAGADRYLNHGDKIEFGNRYLEVRATPGHTGGCLTYVLDDQSMAFTGDALLIRGCGRTDFQQGDASELYRSIHEQIFALPDDSLLYPGHDYRGLTVTSVAEEKQFNPRLGGDLSEDDFAGYMANLGLPHPKKLAIAVPANMVCGKPEAIDIPVDEPTWAPLSYTFAGIWEIQPQWLEDHQQGIQIIDVREPGEFEGPLGRIAGSTLIPLGEIETRSGEISKDKPVVAVCRAGGRSAQATVILKRAGFDAVANLAGGMLRWRAQRCAVEGGSE